MKSPPSNPAGRRLDFRDHRRELGENRYVYPVVSRRSGGLSIGINLNPDKVCNFDCPYCQVDRTVPGATRDVDLALLEMELNDLLGRAAGDLWSHPPFDTVAPSLRTVRDIALSGDGEPTSCPGFGKAIEAVQRARLAHGLPDLPLVLITNATLFHRPAVSAALHRFTELGGCIWAKLDAGTEPFFHQVCGTTLSFDRVLQNIGEATQHHRVTLQCMFHRTNGEAPPAAEVQAWSRRIAGFLERGGCIEGVQVYTVARAPADPACTPLTKEELEQIAALPQGLGLQVEVFC